MKTTLKLMMVFLLIISSCAKKKEETPKAKQKQEAPTEVNILKVGEQEISVSSELFGRVQPTNVAEIRPQVNGIILERSFKEGSYVKEGDQLYLIDPARYKVALEMARGGLEQAKAKIYSTKSLMSRYKKLIKQNAISKQEYDNAKAALQEAEANLQIAKAEVENAKINLEYTKVLSPISGYIGKSNVTKGALVTANQPTTLAIVRSLDPVYVDLSLPSSEALQLRKRLGQYLVKDQEGEGLTVTIKIDQSNENYPYKGKIAARELAVDEQSGAVGIRAVVPNPDLILLPGMFVHAFVDQLGFGNKIVVPQAAVVRDKNGDAHVWLLTKNKTVERKRIETGAMHEKNWIVESGLTPGQSIVIDDLAKLNSGMPVSPLPVGAQAQQERRE